MKEKIDRQTDENLYQPKIHSRRIRELYALKLITGLPMTVLVDLAIKEFIEKSQENPEIIYNRNMKEGEPPKEPISKDCSYCGPGYPATREIVSDKGQEFVCDNHYFILNEIHAIRTERLLSEAEWTINSHFEERLLDHGTDDIDSWEDGSLYGF